VNPEHEVAFCDALWVTERDALFDEVEARRLSQARTESVMSLAAQNKRRVKRPNRQRFGRGAGTQKGQE